MVELATSRSVLADHIRRKLASTRLPTSPNVLDGGLPKGWPDSFRQHLQTDMVAAGVLLPIVEHQHELSVLFTERSAGLKHHPGQISFPGGRMESFDADVRHTALRETEEEVGIFAAQIEVLGYLDMLPTITGYVVTPVVGLVQPGFSLRVDPSEVADVFEVPLDFLMDDRNQRHSVRKFNGTEIPILEFQYDSYRIWGATAAMLLSLRNLLNN